MISSLCNSIARFRRSEDGIAAALVALLMPVFLIAAGLGVDLSLVHFARARIQQEANIAALAGAQVLNPLTGPSQAVSQANASVTNNTSIGLIQNRSVTVDLICSTTARSLVSVNTSVSTCTASDKANAVRVLERATVPMFFGRFVGKSSQNIAAAGVAAANISGTPKLNIMLVLDTTGSMNSTDPNCSTRTQSVSKLNCALTGITSILSQLSPSAQQIGISIFPGLQNSSGVNYASCATTSSNPPPIAAYNANPIYTVFTPGGTGTTSYSTIPSGQTTPSLNTNSPLVKSVSTSVSNCGITATGGVGTYFADAITKAQQTLVSSRPSSDWQNVMVVLSDGDAGASASNMPPSKSRNQCQQAIDAAKTATAAGTWVFSLAYDASTSSGCSTDTGLTPCSTMKQIASDTSKFYSSASSGTTGCVSTGGSSMSNIAAAFTDIPGRLSKPRLIPIE